VQPDKASNASDQEILASLGVGGAGSSLVVERVEQFVADRSCDRSDGDASRQAEGKAPAKELSSIDRLYFTHMKDPVNW
jgi:hypothetical protein